MLALETKYGAALVIYILIINEMLAPPIFGI